MNSKDIIQIADIIPPAAPVVSTADSWPFALFLLVSLILIFISVWQRTMTGRKYLRYRQLKQLRDNYLKKRINSRDCAVQLAALLKNTELNKYTNSCANTCDEKQKTWQMLSDKLKYACYSRQSLDAKAMTALLNDSLRWLQKA